MAQGAAPQPQFPDPHCGFELKWLSRRPVQMSPSQLHRVRWGPVQCKEPQDMPWAAESSKQDPLVGQAGAGPAWMGTLG